MNFLSYKDLCFNVKIENNNYNLTYKLFCRKSFLNFIFISKVQWCISRQPVFKRRGAVFKVTSYIDKKLPFWSRYLQRILWSSDGTCLSHIFWSGHGCSCTLGWNIKCKKLKHHIGFLTLGNLGASEILLQPSIGFIFSTVQVFICGCF